MTFTNDEKMKNDSGAIFLLTFNVKAFKKKVTQDTKEGTPKCICEVIKEVIQFLLCKSFALAWATHTQSVVCSAQKFKPMSNNILLGNVSDLH